MRDEEIERLKKNLELSNVIFLIYFHFLKKKIKKLTYLDTKGKFEDF
jgi:hypothetical protein